MTKRHHDDDRMRARGELRRRHRVEEVLDLDPEGRRVYHDRVRDQDTLDWLRSRGKLTAEQYRAGARLRAAWYAAGYEGLRARSLMRISDRPAPGAGMQESEARLDAQQRVMEATRVIGKARSWLTITIVCAGTRLRDVEQEMEIRQGSALELLRTALDDLAHSYLDGGERFR
jgi:hypothetical protein